VRDERARQTESLIFNAGGAGAKSFQISIEALEGEENLLNNAVTSLVSVESDRPRILYIEGEPRWSSSSSAAPLRKTAAFSW